MPSELLQQVRVLDPLSNSDRIADVLIENGVIKQLDNHITDFPENAQVCDRPNLVLGPGLIDLYSHSGEPGFEARETLDSLLQAAIAGGFTRLTILPDTNPALDNPAVLEFFQSKLDAYASDRPYLYHWGALTVGAAGKQMAELTELAEAGVVGFADGQPLPSPLLTRRLLEYAYPLGKPIALWCCDRDLAETGVVREGVESLRLGLPGTPAIAETSALAALLEWVEAIGTPVHLMRISTARSVELIRAAKIKGLPITASTTWMHVLLDVTAVHSYDPSLRLEPPLGNPDDRVALIQGINDGVIDAIAVDHSPYTYEEKTVAFASAPPGAIGLELALPLLWQGLVTAGKVPALTLWRCLSTNPAHCLRQSPAAIAPNHPSELTLFDPHETWKIVPYTLKSHSSNTPWLGQEIAGRVIQVWQG